MSREMRKQLGVLGYMKIVLMVLNRWGIGGLARVWSQRKFLEANIWDTQLSPDANVDSAENSQNFGVRRYLDSRVQRFAVMPNVVGHEAQQFSGNRTRNNGNRSPQNRVEHRAVTCR